MTSGGKLAKGSKIWHIQDNNSTIILRIAGCLWSGHQAGNVARIAILVSVGLQIS